MSKNEYLRLGQIFLLVDLREFFFRSRVGGTKQKKNSENDQLTGHFQSFFFNISKKTGDLRVKLVR